MGKKSLLLISALLVLTGCTQEPVEQPVETTAANDVLLEGSPCEVPGEKAQGPRGLMLCTYMSYGDWAYQAVNSTGEFPGQFELAQLPVEQCKIEDKRPPEVRYFGATGFPAPESRMPATGVVKIAIIPIDFPDAIGVERPMDLIGKTLSTIDAWNEFFTDGAVQYEWVISEDWLTMPKDSKYYVWDKSYISPSGENLKMSDKQLQTNQDQATQVFTEAEKVMDLEGVEYAWIFSNPEAKLVDWGPGPTNSATQTVRTATNTYQLDYFPIGTYLFGNNPQYSHNRPLWTSMLHEMGHAHGIAGHAPGNEWTFDYMTAGGTLNAWNGWIMGWIPDEEFVCLDGTTPATHKVLMDSVDLNLGGTIATVIRLSSHEVLVIESRKKGPFSIDFQPSMNNIMAYYVNTKREANRFDGNLAREMDYYSYFVRIEDSPRAWDPGSYQVDPNILGQVGDTLAFENIRIKFVDSTNFDTIEIEVLD